MYSGKDTYEDINFSSSAQPVIDGNAAYIPTANKGLIAYNTDEMTEEWRFETGKAMIYMHRIQAVKLKQLSQHLC